MDEQPIGFDGKRSSLPTWKGVCMKSQLLRYFSLFSILLFSNPLLLAAATRQAGQAELTGEVRDQTGAVIGNVSVSATEIRTNQTSTSNTGSSGAFTLTNLKPGLYTVTVEAKG